MNASPRLLLLTASAETGREVSAALAANGSFTLNGSCGNMAEMLACLESQSFPIALVDIDPQPGRTLADLAPVISRYPQTRFVVLCHEMRGEWILAAMRAGARNFLVKASIPAELASVLHQLGPEEEYPGGSIVSLLSAGGGCGATTVALNLADDLRLITSQQVLIVDLDTFHGAIGSWLGLEGAYGVVDVMSHSGRVDPALVLSTAVRYANGLSVLLSPASTDFASPVPPDYTHLSAMLESCKRTCAFTVIDAPRLPMDVSAELAAHSLQTWIVLQLNVRDVRTARSIVSALTRHGVPSETLRAVVNRYHRRSGVVSIEDAQKALAPVQVVRLRNDYRSASRGMNYGKPLSQVAKRSKLSQDIHELAQMLALAQGSGTGTRTR